MTSVADRIKETTTTTGTGAITLSGAQTGFNSFSSAFAVGSSVTFYYTISSNGGAEWETGFGYLSGSTTLVRQTVTGSSNAGALVSFSAGNKDVYCSATAAMLEYAAINQSKSGTVVASFVYDTTEDSDGGAWRDRCSHLSWYNETLNTATRGATRKFPAIAGIVATASTVTIYDLTDVTAPMWRVWTAGGSYTFTSWSNNTLPVLIDAGAPITSVTASNGMIYVGKSNGSNSGTLIIIELINDAAYYNTTTILKKYVGTLAEAYAGYTQDTTKYGAIVNTCVQCITATVLPTAPIDNATGLPVPTVWVGTLGGVSRIAEDGTVSSWTDTSGSAVHQVYNIGISGDYVFWNTDTSSYQLHTITYPITSSLTTFAYNSTSYRHYTSITGVSWSSSLSPIFYSAISSICRDITKNAFATDRSLTILQPNTTGWGKGLHATITTNSNSGMQWGDIRGAWLCQGTAETLTGSGELITNGTFDTNTTGWTATNGATLSVSSAQLLITPATNFAGAQQAITTTVGKSYAISGNRVAGTATYVQVGTASGTGAGSYNILNIVDSVLGAFSYTFTATTSTTYITLESNGAGGTATFGNISCKLAEPDFSYKNQALTVVGSIVKSAVNTGCDLMGYSGWSASNYMQMAYNSAYDFGTGDFHISAWIKKASTASNGTLIARADTGTTGWGSGAFFVAKILNSSGYFQYGSNGLSLASTISVVTSNWTKVDIVRLSGTVSIYINGTFNTSGTDSSNLTNTSALLYVGVAKYNGSILDPIDTMDLLHISAGAPTSATIKSRYEEEKRMFVANTKSLLPGTSNDVKAVAYDDSTGIHHYVTGDYYGAHKGLVRVDSAAGVYTSISAKNGAVIKGA